jgi:type IV pilus assembly protein PilM
MMIDPRKLKNWHLKLRENLRGWTIVKESAVGVHGVGGHLFAALLESSGGKITLKSLEKVSSFSDQPQHAHLVSGLDTAEVLIRSLHVNVVKDKDIAAIFDFQVESILPFPIDEGAADWAVIQKEKKSTKLSVCAAYRTEIEAHLENLHQQGLDPETVSCVPAALAKLMYQIHKMEALQGVLYLGEASTACLLVHKDKILEGHSISIGSQHLVEALSELGSLEQLFSMLCAEVQKIFYAMTAHKGKHVEITQFFKAGAWSDFSDLESRMAQTLQLPLLSIASDGWLNLDSQKVEQYAVPLGLALLGFSNCKSPMNFRKKRYAYPHPWRRLKKPLTAYFGLSLLFGIVGCLFAHALLHYQQQDLIGQYHSLVSIASPLESSPASAQELSVEDLKTQVEKLSQKFKEMPETFALVPNVPRVSDVMAWLATHPKIVMQDSSSQAKKGIIQIENFRYLMKHHPDVKNPKGKYQVMVELEFNAASPTIAREFHDALMTENPFIDPKSEVQWTTNKGQYRASFALKDKTVYPSL